MHPTGMLSTARIEQLLAQGQAQPLLSGGIPGPMRLDGRWWAVPSGQTYYQPVHADVAATFDREAARLAAYRTYRSNVVDLTGQRRQ